MKKTGNGSADLPGRVLALACVLVFALLVAASPAWAADSGSRDMYRLYNPNSGEHFYTAKTSERDGLVRIGWNYEGVGWVAPKKSNNPVYRLYSGTDHHYTMSTAERDSLIRAGWRYEGVGWYSAEGKQVKLYRQFNPNVNPGARRNNSGSHNYTTSKAENDNLVAHGWRAEGVGWYGIGGGRVVQGARTSTRPAAPSAPSSSSTTTTRRGGGSGGSSVATPQSGIVYYTAHGKRYHQSRTCPAIVNRRVWSCTVAQAQAKGLTPCHDCY